MAYDSTDFTAPVRILDRDPKSLTTPRERLEYLRDFLRELPDEKFSMCNSGMPEEEGEPWCGTSGCYYGWTIALFAKRGALHNDYWAAETLGLPSSEADIGGLFYPQTALSDGERAIDLRDPKRAANVLDHLIRTGLVDWSVA